MSLKPLFNKENSMKEDSENLPSDGVLLQEYIDSPWGTWLFWPVIILLLVGVNAIAIVLEFYRTVGQPNLTNQLLFSMFVISIGTIVGYLVARILKLEIMLVDILAVISIGYFIWQFSDNLVRLIALPDAPLWLVVLAILILPVAAAAFALNRWTNTTASEAVAVVLVAFVVANMVVYSFATYAGVVMPGL